MSAQKAELDKLMAAGRLKQRQEPWVALGGRLQGKHKLSYEEIKEIAQRDAKGGTSGYHSARPPEGQKPKRERRKSA